MGKTIAKEIKEGRQKVREDKQAKKVINLGIVANYVAQRAIKKHIRVVFIVSWPSTIIKVMGDKFHQNFHRSLQIDPNEYLGMNIGSTIVS
jgi:hypothetical protein